MRTLSPPITILNVDERKINRYTRSRVLRQAGFVVKEAATGGEALRVIQQEYPALVLLDVNLPDISGLEVCRRIKSDLALASTLVLQISASLITGLDKACGLEGGADACLIEPVEPAELVASVKALLRLWEARQALEQAVERITCLQAVTAAISKALTPAQVAEVIITQALPALNAVGGWIYRLSRDETGLEMVATAGYPAEVVERWRWIPLAVPLPVTEAYRLKQWVSIGSIEAMLAQYPAIDTPAEEMAGNWVAIPLLVHDQAIGVFALTFATTPEFSQADQEFVLTLAGQCALALNKARLYHHALTEITERKRAEAEISSLARFPGENPNPILRVSRDGVILYANRASQAWLKTWDMDIGSRAPQAWDETIFRALETGKSEEFEMAIGPKIFTFICAPFPESGYVNFYGHDITDRKQAERERERLLQQARRDRAAIEALAGTLELERDVLQAIMENTPAQLAYLDAHFNFVLVNSAYVRSSGHPREELIGHNHFELFPSAENQAIFEQVRETGRPVAFYAKPFEYADQPERGITYWDWSLVPIKDDKGQVQWLVFSLLEVTELQQARETSEAARRAAEAANRAKSDFLAKMSHELRTPLNAILGYTQIFKRDRTLSPEQQEGIEIIHQSGEHLLQMINDTLDVAKVEAGKLELQPAPVSLLHFLKFLTKMVQVRAEQKGLTFSYQLDPGLPGGVYVDEKRLREVLLNLLSNAINYTEAGRVELTVAEAAPPGEKGVGVRFQVSDTGIGVAPEALEEIFTPFYQVGGLASYIEGTGLGLAISRRLVELLGGDLQVSSTPGQGSTFWFDLVLPPAAVKEPVLGEAGPVQAIAGFNGGPVKILIVDDRRDSRLPLRELLSRLGFTVAEAANGREALDVISTTPVDLILMDLFMPVMGGFEALRHIRQKYSPADMPVIAVSASVSGNIRELCQTFGANDFLAKPIQLEDLFACLTTHLKLEWRYDTGRISREASAKPGPQSGGREAGAAKREPRSGGELAAREFDRPAERSEIVLPPAEELRTLRDLARDGFITGIEQFLTRISQADEVYRPFAGHVSRLADRFEFEEILAWVDQFLEEAS